jgi:hypothetical protein
MATGMIVGLLLAESSHSKLADLRHLNVRY